MYLEVSSIEMVYRFPHSLQTVVSMWSRLSPTLSLIEIERILREQQLGHRNFTPCMSPTTSYYALAVEGWQSRLMIVRLDQDAL